MGGLVRVESADDVGLVDQRRGGDVGVVNRRQMNDRVHADHRFHDLAEIQDVADQIFHRTALGTWLAIEDRDSMGLSASAAADQFGDDNAADFAETAGDQDIHWGSCQPSAVSSPLRQRRPENNGS